MADLGNILACELGGLYCQADESCYSRCHRQWVGYIVCLDINGITVTRNKASLGYIYQLMGLHRLRLSQFPVCQVRSGSSLQNFLSLAACLMLLYNRCGCGLLAAYGSISQALVVEQAASNTSKSTRSRVVAVLGPARAVSSLSGIEKRGGSTSQVGTCISTANILP